MKNFNKIWLIITLVCTGAAIMVVEILGTRIIAPYFGTTLYVWTALITVTMLALALGYYFGGRIADKKPVTSILYIIVFIASVLLLIIPLLDTPVLKLTSKAGITWGPLIASLLLFLPSLLTLGMITPFAVRLRTKQVEIVGRTVGNFYATATAGSLVGALVVAYALIPNFKLSTILLTTSILLLLISAVWYAVHKKVVHTAIFIAFMAIFILVTQPTQEATAELALEEVQSFYGDITVEIISTDLTCILVNNIPQSCYNPDMDGSAFPYTRLMVRSMEQLENSQKVLVIGDGGGLISREILKKHDVEIDAVDIDAKIFELGKKYLHFKDSPQVNKIVADGRYFLQESAGGYDAIFIDAFTDSTPVLHLYTKEMFELAKQRINTNGVLVLNSFGFNKGEGIETTKSLYKTLKTVYNDVYVSPSGNADINEREYFNFVLFASDQELKRIGRIFTPEIATDTPVITDSYNPLEHFSLPASQELIDLYVLGIDD